MHHGSITKGFTGLPKIARERWPLLLLAVVAFFLALSVKASVFPLYSGDNDEPVYVFQARMLLHGDVTLPADEQREFFRPWLTGERDGKLFPQYQPGWPAALAASQRVFGTIRYGPPLVAAGLVFAVYGLAIEVTRRRRTALVATTIAALSPMLVLQSGLFLSYSFATFLVVAMAACALRGERTGRRRWLLAAGALFGACILTRPFDAVLFALPLIAAAAVRHRHRLRVAIGQGVVTFAGAVPFLTLAALYNRTVTGSPFLFPMAAADPLDTFGFGPRRMLPDQAAIDYSAVTALKALGQNLAGAPEWVLGAWVGVAIAAFAMFERADRSRRVLLLALVSVFPLGYLFWWATAFSAAGARNGLGPHYYVPAFVPLAILLAWGIDDLSRRIPARARAAVALAAVAATVVVIPPKLEANLAVTDHFQSIAAAVPPGMQNSVVFLRPDNADSNYLLTPWPFLENGPGLDDPVLYAIDRGAANGRLMEQYPNRSPYRLRPEIQPGQGLDAKGRLDAVAVRKTERLELRVRITNPTWKPAATGFIKLGNQLKLVPLLHFGDQTSYEATFFVAATDTEPSPENENRTVVYDGSPELSVGVSFSDGQSYGSAEVFERRFPIALQPPSEPAPAQLVVQGPGSGWHLVDFGNGAIWLPENIDAVLSELPPR